MSSVPGTPKKRGVPLAAKRKAMISEFRRSYTGEFPVGSPNWQVKLLEYMHETDKILTMDDIVRWVSTHPWITAPQQGLQENEGSTPTSIDQVSARQQRASSRSSNGSFDLPLDRPMPVLTNEAEYPAPVPPPVMIATNEIAEAEYPTSAPPPAMIETNEITAVAPTTTIPANQSAFSMSIPTMRPLVTPTQPFPIATNAPEFNFSNISSQSVVPDSTIMNSQQSTSSMNMSMSEEQFKAKCFMTAFNAIGDLHEVCKLMPEVRVCLRPLKEIHRVFVRNHEKFIFPEDYTTVSAANRPQMKVDPNFLNEIDEFQPQIVDIGTDD